MRSGWTLSRPSIGLYERAFSCIRLMAWGGLEVSMWEVQREDGGHVDYGTNCATLEQAMQEAERAAMFYADRLHKHVQEIRDALNVEAVDG